MGPTDVAGLSGSQTIFNSPSTSDVSDTFDAGEVTPEKRMIDSAMGAPDMTAVNSQEPKSFNLTGKGEPRPLSGAAGHAADEAADIVASPMSQTKKLRALADMREKAVSEGNTAGAAYLETVGVRQLFAPIGESVVSMPEKFTDELGFLPGRLMTDNSPDALETLKADLSRLKGELKDAGQLTPEAADAFNYLGTLVDDKAGIVGLMDLASSAYNDGHGVSLRQAADMSQTAAVMARGDGPGRPAFSHVLMRGVAARAEKDVAAWSKLSAEHAKPIADDIDAAKAALDEPRGLDDVTQRLDELKARIGNEADSMLVIDETALKDKFGELNEAYSVTKLTTEVKEKMDNASVPDLRKMKGDMESLRSSLETTDTAIREKLETVLGDVAVKIIHAESDFNARFTAMTTGIEDSIGASFEVMQTKIDAARSFLETSKVPTDSKRAELASTLDRLEDDAFAAPYKADMAKTFSALLDAPSADKIAESIRANDHLSEGKKTELLQKLADDSAAMLATFTDRLTSLEGSLGGQTFDELRSTDLTPFTRAADKLLSSDATLYAERFDQTMGRIESALFAQTETRPEVQALDADAKEGLRSLLKATAYHPSVLKALSEEGTLPASVLTAVNTASKTPAQLTPELTEGLDRLIIEHPELDRGVLALAVGLVPDNKRPDTATHFMSVSIRRDAMAGLKSTLSESAQKKLGLQGKTLDIATLEKLVMATDSDKKLGQTDLLLARALWYERQAQGQSFEEFRATLPKNLANTHHLQKKLDAGLRNTRKAEEVVQCAATISKGFGGKLSLAKVVDRLTSSDDRYAAGRALTRMAQEHLSKPGRLTTLTGRDAMKGDATALRMAIEAKRNKVSSTDLLAAKMKVFFKKAEGITLQDASVQLADFVSSSADLKAEYDRLAMDNTKLANAATALLTTPERQKYIAVLETARPGNEIVASLKNGDSQTTNLSGAKAAMATVILNETLQPDLETPTEEQLVDMKAKLAPLTLQNKLDILAMEGHAKLVEENVTPETAIFRDLLSAFQSTPSAKNRQAILDFIDENKLMLKADAVLFFKHGKKQNGSDNVTRKIGQVYKTGDPTKMRDVLSRLRTRMQTYGLGERQTQSADAVLAMKESNTSQMEAELNKSYEHFSARVAASIDNTVSIALCEAFLQGKDADSAAQLVADRGKYEMLKDWPFYQAVEAQTTKLGLDPAVASPFILKALSAMTAETFTSLNTSTARSPHAIAKKMAERLRRQPEAMREMIKTGQFEVLADRVIDKLADPGQTLVLQHSKSAKMEIPAFKTELVEVDAKIAYARQKGVTLWKGEDGQFNMILMGKHAAAVGVAVSAFDDKLTADAEVSANIGKGCALTFDSGANCSAFLAHLMAGQFNGDDLGFVKTAAPVLTGGIGASINVGVELETSGVAGVAAQDVLTGHSSIGEEGTIDRLQGDATIGASVGLSGSLQWTRTESLTSTLYENERRAAFSAELGITTAPKAEEAEEGEEVDGGDEADDDSNDIKIIREDGLRQTEEPEEPADPNERNVTVDALFSFDVKESISVANDGRLLSAKTVRTFDPSDSRSVDGMLSRQGVSPACVNAVMAALEKTQGPVKIEVHREVPQSTVDRLVDSKAKMRPEDYRSVEVCIVSTDGAASIRNGLSTKHLELTSSMQGAFNRTQHFNAMI